jgi:hypothetical protein
MSASVLNLEDFGTVTVRLSSMVRRQTALEAPRVKKMALSRATEVPIERRGHMHINASNRSVLIALAAAAAFAFTPASAMAESAGAEYGIGVGCVLVNLVYGPAKVLYATGGAIVSGFAYVFTAGNSEVARPILNAAMRGDYVLVPDQLKGKKPIVFVSRSPGYVRATEPRPLEDSPDEGFCRLLPGLCVPEGKQRNGG